MSRRHRHLRPLVLVASLASLALLPAGARAADSPMFRFDPAHSGVSPGGALADPGAHPWRVRWRFPTHAPVFSTPAVVGGVAYFGSADGNVYAVDVRTGAQRWRCSTGARVTSSPAVAGGRVFFTSYDGTFYAVDQATGKPAWKFATGGEHRFTATHLHGALPAAESMPDPFDVYLSSPCVVGGVVYFGSGDGHVYALDARTGSQRWKVATGDVVHASPAVVNGTVYVGSWDSWFYALDAATGARRWRFRTGTDPEIHNQVGISSSALVAGGTVYFGCRDGHLYALDARTGAKRWAYSAKPAWITSSPVLAGGAVWVGVGSSKRLVAVDARTGVERYGRSLDRAIFGSGAVSGGWFYVGGLDGKLMAVNVATHAQRDLFQTAEARQESAAYQVALARVQADTLSTDVLLYDNMVRRFTSSLTGSFYGSPVVVGDAIYIGSTDGCLYALSAGR